MHTHTGCIIECRRIKISFMYAYAYNNCCMPTVVHVCTHPTQQILTTEVNLVERACLPRVEPAFMDATICTLSSPTHSKLLS